MDIIRLLILIAVVGLVAWLLAALVPMPAVLEAVLIAVAAIGCLLLALRGRI